MTKQEFDAALDYMMSVPPRTLVELQRDLRKLKLRIVPSEPVAWARTERDLCAMTTLQERAARLLEFYDSDADLNLHQVAGFMSDAADLIRDQAARIAELESSVIDYNKHWIRDDDLERLTAAIMKAGAESADEFAAIDCGPTPLRGRVTRRDDVP